MIGMITDNSKEKNSYYFPRVFNILLYTYQLEKGALLG
jgi:hypothetical protein